MQRLAGNIAEIKNHYTVVVVGSGYGASIAASRMARAQQKVCVLERGKEWLPGEYPRTPLQAAKEMQVDFPEAHVGDRRAIYDLRVNRDISVFLGCGLGGTSLVNANVSLRADPRVFEDPRWPVAIRAEATRIAGGDGADVLLSKGYHYAEEMLKPTPYPDAFPALPKLTALERSAKELGAKVYRPPINVTFEEKTNHVGVEQHACKLCGDCVTGCNHGAKNTLLMNYLPDAKNHGAEIFTQVAVRHLEHKGGRWIVHYELLGSESEKFRSAERFLTADIVILGAGALGSTEILLRSTEHGLGVSSLLGKRFTGNGDVLGFAYNCDSMIDGVGFGSHSEEDRDPVGPCIAGIIDLRDHPDVSQGMVIEDGSIPGAISGGLPQAFASALRLDRTAGREPMDGAPDLPEGSSAATTGGPAGPVRRELDSLMLGPHHGAVRNTQTFLVMTHDDGAGEMNLENDRLRIRWDRVGEQPIFEKVSGRLEQAARAVGGAYVRNPVWSQYLHRKLVTVHPLGGCVMADDVQHGVVNHKGQVFNPGQKDAVHPGLYVCDGSIVPSPLGVNPLLTICALAERESALIAADHGWSIDYTLPSLARQESADRTVGIEFTECMTGHFSLHVLDDFQHGAKVGEGEGSSIRFVVTITTEDVHGLIEHPSHEARMSGMVEAPALSKKPLSLTEGTFRLFTKNVDAVETRNMIYRMRLASEEGQEYLLEGLKVVRDDGILNVWRDTTTLYVTIRGGGQQQQILGKGVMRIRSTDFLRQLSTMRATNAASVQERLRALSRFGNFFASVLFNTYAGIFAPLSSADSFEAPREKRALRVRAPDVHFFETADRTQLRLTRYQAGAKGPVLLSHSLGSSSRIFSIDTIDPNLLEFLAANDFDVWLLDHRASIDLSVAKTQFTADEIALYDYPAAVNQIRAITGSDSIQVVAHGFGAMAFCMAMLAGLRGVRSAVCSQMGTDIATSKAARLKAGLHMPELLEALHIHSLSADVTNEERWYQKLYDRALQFTSFDHGCRSSVCRRINFLYGPICRHENLNNATHEALREMFGVACMKSFDHLALMARVGHLVDANGQEKYMPHLTRLAFPLCFIHGAANECYLPESTRITFDRLCATNGGHFYSRHVIPGYGHIDGILGKRAAYDVYPHILAHLEGSAT